jgi:hypothetical protein
MPMFRGTSRRAHVTDFLGPILSAHLLLTGCGGSSPVTNAPTNPTPPSPVVQSADSAPAPALAVTQTGPAEETAPPPVPEAAATPAVVQPSKEATPDNCGCTVLIPSTKDGPTQIDECIEKVNGEWVLVPGVRKKIRFSKTVKLAELLSSCGPFYLKKDGTLRQSHFFDDGCDPFSEGRTRIVRDGKYGYMDRSLRIIVEPIYEYVYPFSCGYGQVCNDCTTTSYGEHYSTACDTCGLVNKKGTLVLPLGSSEEEMEALRATSKLKYCH